MPQRSLRRWLALCLLMLLSHPPAWAGAAPGPLPADLAAELDTLLRHSKVRGAAVVLVDTSGPTGAMWFGSADAARGAALNPDHCMRVGAVSKTFTSLLAMRLSDQGKLDLDAPLPADLHPAAPSATAAACTGRVSVAQLLEQTAGVTDDGPRSTAAPNITRRPLSWCPGSHFKSSADSITLAAAALERAGGADFDTLMQREVFKPLGLTTARFASRETLGCLSHGYAADGREIVEATRVSAPAAHALVATPLELARVVQTLLRYGDGPQGHLLEPCSIAHMAAGTTGLASRLGASAGAEGRGLVRFTAGGRLMLGYSGSVDGFQTTFGFAPEAGRGMVIMVNTADRDTMTRLQDAVAAFLWRDLRLPPLPALERAAAGISGWYARTSDGMPLLERWAAMSDLVRIEQESHGLLLRGLWPWQAPRRVLAVTATSFRDEALPMASTAFFRQPDGQRWWIDRESFREVSPSAATGQLAAPALVALMLILAVTVLIFFLLRRLLRRILRSAAYAAPRAALASAPCLLPNVPAEGLP